MKVNKSRVAINRKKFQLIGEDGQRSKEINLKQNRRYKLTNESQQAIVKGLERSSWIWRGYLDYNPPITGNTFVNLMKSNTTKNKKILVIGPGEGNDVKFLKDRIANCKIDSFDLKNFIKKECNPLINKKMHSTNGIENYQNKSLLGKYNGIMGAYSAGYWTKYPERNLFKVATMLAPGGVAVLNVKERPRKNATSIKNKLDRIISFFKLQNQFEITYYPTDFIFIIKRI
jgi:hypothetical protein